MGRKPRIVGLLLVCLVVAVNSSPAPADENLFGYLYGAEVLPAHQNEVYQWLTVRRGKGIGHYVAWDASLEYERGLDNRWQFSAYVNAKKHSVHGVPGLEKVDSAGFSGAQVAFKYMALSPFKDPVGLAFYIEPGYARIDKVSGERIKEYELESKLIVQKNFLEDRLVAAVNATLEFEVERGAGAASNEKEFVAELTAGLSYRVAPRWFVGLETRWHTEFPQEDDFSQEHLAHFFGPVVHYGAEHWWFTATWLPQISGWPTEARDRDRQLDEHERNECRLKLGFNF